MNNLSLIRTLYGVTQSEFAELIEVNRGSISCWESGKKKMSELSIYKLSNYLRIDAEYIYDKELTLEIKEKIINAGKRYRLHKSDKTYFKTDYIQNERTMHTIIQEYLFRMEREKLEVLYKFHEKILLEIENAISKLTENESFE